MKRSAITIAVLLILGTTSSAALVWWCALRDAESATAQAAQPDPNRDFIDEREAMRELRRRDCFTTDL